MSKKNKSGKAQRAISAINEKICFSKEVSSIGTAGAVKLLKGGAAKFLNYIGRSFAYASTRTYGCFLLSFGLVSLFLQFAEFYFKSEPGDALSYIIINAVIALLGIPLLIFDRPMCIALQDFFITDYIFFEFLSIKRMHRDANVSPIKMLGGIFLGFIPAVTSFFVPIQYVLLTLLLITVISVAFTTPEFPMILMILLLPYVPILPYSDIVLVCACGVAFLSYALKVALGKRVYNFSVYDLIIIALAVLCVVVGFLGRFEGSLRNSFVFAMLLLAYIPAGNLIVNRRLADLAVNAVVVSSIPIAVLSVVEFVVENLNPRGFSVEYSTPGISVFFTKPDALAAFLLVSAVLSAGYAIEKRHMWKKIFYFCVFILEVGILGLMMQPFAWLSIFLGMPAYFVITSKKLPIELLIIIFVLPFALFAIPAENVDSVYEFLRISPSFLQITESYSNTLNIFLENIWLGIGVGNENCLSEAGMINTPLAIAAQLGVFGIALLALLIIILLRQLSYYRRFMTNSSFTTVKNMSALAITVVLLFGAGADILNDKSVFCLFFTVFGICISVMRSARRDHDDRLSYYGDSRSAESSVIDVNIGY